MKETIDNHPFARRGYKHYLQDCCDNVAFKFRTLLERAGREEWMWSERCENGYIPASGLGNGDVITCTDTTASRDRSDSHCVAFLVS